MSDDHVTVLPDNASLLERGLENAWQTLLGRINPPFPELLNPEATPAEFLPWLAADRGVSEWRSGDGEQRKRRAIAMAWPIARMAGTRAAIINAALLAGFSARFIPWHDAGLDPYTVALVATSDRAQTPDDYDRFNQRLLEAKAERDTVKIKVEKTVTLTQRLHIAQVTQQASHQRIAPARITLDTPVTGVTIGSALQTARTCTLMPARDIGVTPRTHIVACVIRAATIMTVGAP